MTVLHDIKDPIAFVRSTIAKRKGKPLTQDEHEELLAAGLLALVNLADNYRPGFGGADPATSRFSGYAAMFLPRKLDTAYHSLRGDTLATGENGARHWHYHDVPVSLDSLTEDDPDGADHVHALHSQDAYEGDVAQRIRAALDEQWAVDREDTVRFAVLLGMDHTLGEAQRTLGLTGRDALAAVERIRRVSSRLGAMEEAA